MRRKNNRFRDQILRYSVQILTTGWLLVAPHVLLAFCGHFFEILESKIQYLQNRNSHLVEFVSLRIMMFFICISIAKYASDSLARLNHFSAGTGMH